MSLRTYDEACNLKYSTSKCLKHAKCNWQLYVVNIIFNKELFPFEICRNICQSGSRTYSRTLVEVIAWTVGHMCKFSLPLFNCTVLCNVIKATFISPRHPEELHLKLFSFTTKMKQKHYSYLNILYSTLRTYNTLGYQKRIVSKKYCKYRCRALKSW